MGEFHNIAILRPNFVKMRNDIFWTNKVHFLDYCCEFSILAQAMWEGDRWAPAKQRLTPPKPVVTPFITLEWR